MTPDPVAQQAMVTRLGLTVLQHLFDKARDEYLIREHEEDQGHNTAVRHRYNLAPVGMPLAKMELLQRRYAKLYQYRVGSLSRPYYPSADNNPPDYWGSPHLLPSAIACKDSINARSACPLWSCIMRNGRVATVRLAMSVAREPWRCSANTLYSPRFSTAKVGDGGRRHGGSETAGPHLRYAETSATVEFGNGEWNQGKRKVAGQG